MAVTTIGSSTKKCRLGDNETAGQGTWEWYFDAQVPEAVAFPLLYESHLAQGVSTGIAGGGRRRTIEFLHILVPLSDYTNIKKATVAWNGIGSAPIYCSVKRAGTTTNYAEHAVGNSMYTVRLRIMRYTVKDISTSMIELNLYCTQFNSITAAE